MDWGAPGIIAVGDRGSVTFIEEVAGPSWNLVYTLNYVYPYDSADFKCVVIVSQGVAVIGGKPIPGVSVPTPSLFKWSIPNGVPGTVFNTQVPFGTNCWIEAVDYAPGLDKIVAGSRAASAGAVVAIYPYTSQDYCYKSVICPQEDNIESLSLSPNEDYLLTAGSSRGTNYTGCNTRQSFGGCSLTFLDEIQSVKSTYCNGTASITHLGRPLGAICHLSRTAFVFLDDGVEPYFSTYGAEDLDQSESRHLIVSSMGKVFSFDDPVLSVPGLVSGQTADLRVDFASAGGLVAFGWSRIGTGPSTVPGGSCGPIVANLSTPIHSILPFSMAGPNGVAQTTVSVPPGATGIQIWIQAIDHGTCRVTNVVPLVIG